MVRARAISRAIVLTKRILASCSSRCSNLRGWGYLLEGLVVGMFMRGLPNPSHLFDDDTGCSRPEKEGHRISSPTEASGPSLFGPRPMSHDSQGVGPPCSATSSRAPWFSSSSKQKSRPPLTGIGRAAKGVLNQDAQTVTPKEGRVSCEGHSEGYADGMAPLSAVRCKNIEHVERVSGSFSSSLKRWRRQASVLVESHEASGNRNVS